ncbi:STAS domain-containing protein [Gordonia sp. 'Campus']|uniref:STAS domain-containing protein n=1 Tax=Gordonia sp. 'Campus' TaxID=2915824 RepID=UPI001EE466CC|nr:STAS domain-containing protein [Gordonia sp. 'Campus']
MPAYGFEPVILGDDESLVHRAMTVTTTWYDHLMILGVRGSIDLFSVPQLRSAVREAVEARPRGLIVDLTHTEFLASSGMAELLAAHTAIAPEGRFGVVAAHPVTTRPLRAAGLDQTLTLYPTLRQAVSAMTDSDTQSLISG